MRWTLDGYSALVIGLLYLRWTRLFRVQCTYNTQQKKKIATRTLIEFAIHCMRLFFSVMPCAILYAFLD
jgi:hypothetical protein